MAIATLRRSVYTKFGGYYAKGAKVYIDAINITSDSIMIKKVNYDGPIRTALKSKDLTIDVIWMQLK